MKQIDFNTQLILDEELSQIDLSEILDCCSRTNYLEAGKLAYELIEEGFLDIRLVCYYFFGLCKDNFLTNAVYIFNSLSAIFQDKYKQLKPLKYKEKQCINALSWFQTELIDLLNYKESKESKISFNATILESYIAYEKNIEQILGELDDKYIRIHRFISERIEEAQVEELDQGEQNIKQNDYEQDQSANTKDPIKIGNNSLKWLELLDKLKVLNELQNKSFHVEAAVLYRHVYHLLLNFNPLEYFPDIFASFYQKALDPNFQNIIDNTESHISSVQWNALEAIVNSNHNLLLSDSLKLQEGFKQVSQHKFYQLIETDEFKNNPPINGLDNISSGINSPAPTNGMYPQAQDPYNNNGFGNSPDLQQGMGAHMPQPQVGIPS